MIESCEQTGHRRMITSALASAQSASRLLCAAENEIKTIVQWGSALGTVTSQDLTQSGAFAPFQNLNWKRISILRHATYFHQQPPCIGRLRSPNNLAKPLDS